MLLYTYVYSQAFNYIGGGRQASQPAVAGSAENVDEAENVGTQDSKSVQFAAPQDIPTTPISSPRWRETERTQMTFDSHYVSSSSSSESDIAPVSKWPVPASPPPRCPLAAWTGENDDSSLAVTPATTPHPSTTESPSVLVVTSPSKMTQTKAPAFQPVDTDTLNLTVPDLSVTDSGSSVSTKGKDAPGKRKSKDTPGKGKAKDEAGKGKFTIGKGRWEFPSKRDSPKRKSKEESLERRESSPKRVTFANKASEENFPKSTKGRDASSEEDSSIEIWSTKGRNASSEEDSPIETRGRDASSEEDFPVETKGKDAASRGDSPKRKESTKGKDAAEEEEKNAAESEINKLIAANEEIKQPTRSDSVVSRSIIHTSKRFSTNLTALHPSNLPTDPTPSAPSQQPKAKRMYLHNDYLKPSCMFPPSNWVEPNFVCITVKPL